MDIRPDYANIEGEDGELEQIDPDDVAVGTVIVVLEFSTRSSILETVDSPNSLVVLIFKRPVRFTNQLSLCPGHFHSFELFRGNWRSLLLRYSD